MWVSIGRETAFLRKRVPLTAVSEGRRGCGYGKGERDLGGLRRFGGEGGLVEEAWWNRAFWK